MQLKQLRRFSCMEGVDIGEQILAEAIELQALKNQCYLELKYQKEENAPTISKQKGRK